MADRESRRNRDADDEPDDFQESMPLGVDEPIRRERTAPTEFMREVRGELRKVAWPNRQEVANYTIVVIVATAFLMGTVFALDFVFGRVIFAVFS